MVGHQFRVNKDFFYTVKDEENKPAGRGKLLDGTIITILDTEIRNGKNWCRLNHSIGWISNTNKLWNHLDLYRTPTVNRDISDDFER